MAARGHTRPGSGTRQAPHRYARRRSRRSVGRGPNPSSGRVRSHIYVTVTKWERTAGTPNATGRQCLSHLGGKVLADWLPRNTTADLRPKASRPSHTDCRNNHRVLCDAVLPRIGVLVVDRQRRVQCGLVDLRQFTLGRFTRRRRRISPNAHSTIRRRSRASTCSPLYPDCPSMQYVTVTIWGRQSSPSSSSRPELIDF